MKNMYEDLNLSNFRTIPEPNGVDESPYATFSKKREDVDKIAALLKIDGNKSYNEKLRLIRNAMPKMKEGDVLLREDFETPEYIEPRTVGTHYNIIPEGNFQKYFA